MPSKTIWISFDLGIRDDYEGLYNFLDLYEGKECGSNLCFLNYSYDKNLLNELSTELFEFFEPSRRARIYVIFPTEEGKFRGRFLIGKRQVAPWAGYAENGEQGEEDESGSG